MPDWAYGRNRVAGYHETSPTMRLAVGGEQVPQAQPGDQPGTHETQLKFYIGPIFYIIFLNIIAYILYVELL